MSGGWDGDGGGRLGAEARNPLPAAAAPALSSPEAAVVSRRRGAPGEAAWGLEGPGRGTAEQPDGLAGRTWGTRAGGRGHWRRGGHRSQGQRRSSTGAHGGGRLLARGRASSRSPPAASAPPQSPWKPAAPGPPAQRCRAPARCWGARRLQGGEGWDQVSMLDGEWQLTTGQSSAAAQADPQWCQGTQKAT